MRTLSVISVRHICFNAFLTVCQRIRHRRAIGITTVWTCVLFQFGFFTPIVRTNRYTVDCTLGFIVPMSARTPCNIHRIFMTVCIPNGFKITCPCTCRAWICFIGINICGVRHTFFIANPNICCTCATCGQTV